MTLGPKAWDQQAFKQLDPLGLLNWASRGFLIVIYSPPEVDRIWGTIYPKPDSIYLRRGYTLNPALNLNFSLKECLGGRCFLGCLGIFSVVGLAGFYGIWGLRGP